MLSDALRCTPVIRARHAPEAQIFKATALQGNLLSWLSGHQRTGRGSFRLSVDDQATGDQAIDDQADITCATEPSAARDHKPSGSQTSCDRLPPLEVGAINDLRYT